MFRTFRFFAVAMLAPILCLVLAATVSAEQAGTIQAGAAIIDITPQQFPVAVNGGFFPRFVETVQDPLCARCLVLDVGREKIALVVIDTCVIPFELAEEIKAKIVSETGLRKDRIMISATHCHSAPSLVRVHGCPPDEAYVAYLPGKIAEVVSKALKNRVAAKVGWAVGSDTNNVYCRRFLMKKGTATTNPFSDKVNDRAMMNPGHANPNKIARTGPVDPAVSVLSVVSTDGKPISVFANYSTHYAGVRGGVLSGDYFGVFSERIREKIAEKVGRENMSDKFVGIMSNGTSGDANCIDFLNPNRKFDYKSVGNETAEAAMVVWPNIEYFDSVTLKMLEKRIKVSNRVPTPEEIQRAKEHVAKLPDGKPKTVPDIYAVNVAGMTDWPKESELPIQAIRIGRLGMTALPAEVYGITGLEIKARSPLAPTVNIGLANGCFGYVPPPEQHVLGGYNTWRTQYNCLEVDAETKIKDTAVELLRVLAEEP